MISALALLCILAPAVLGEAISTVSYAAIEHQNDDGSYAPFEIPNNYETSQERGWEKLDLPSYITDNTLSLYSNPLGHSLGEYYNEAGELCGFNIAIDKSRLSDNQFEPTKQGFTSYTDSINGTTIDTWATYILFDFAGKTITFPGFDGEVMTVSTNLVDNSDWTKQNCVSGGHLRYYKMSSETTCTADQILPVYLITDEEEDVIAFGEFFTATQVVPEGKWTWFVNWPNDIAKTYLATYPSCLDDLKYIGVQIYLKDLSSASC